jgi:hypothetical protein
MEFAYAQDCGSTEFYERSDGWWIIESHSSNANIVWDVSN